MGKEKRGINEKRDINELTNALLVYIDRHSTVKVKASTDVDTRLVMELDEKGFHFTFSVHQHTQGNGSCLIEVLDNGVPLLKASGNYIVGAYNMTAAVYVSGPWCSVKNFPSWGSK